MSYFASQKNPVAIYFGESADADRAARHLGLKPIAAPTIPRGAQWTEISPGLSRIDAPTQSAK